MKISVIIPLYNKEATIAKTIESVLTQNFESIEIVVVDDGSVDTSIATVRKINSDKIKLFTKKNGGPASARNFGVSQSTGDWVLFLDADDTLEPNAINYFAQLITTHPKYSFFCCNHYLSNGKDKFLYSNQYRKGVVCDNFLAWNANELMPRAGAAIFRKSVLLKYPQKEYLRRYEDAESLFDIMRVEKCYRDPTPVMSYNVSTLSASAPRKDIFEDFIGHLSIVNKGLMEQYALYVLYRQGLQIYPDEMIKLYENKMFEHFKYSWIKKYIQIRKFLKTV